MVRTSALGWGINFEPQRTWITTVDSTSLTVLEREVDAYIARKKA